MTDEPIKLTSMTQAWNYLRGLRKKLARVKKSKTGSMDELGVTQGGKTDEQRLKYLSYCLSLLNTEDYPHYTQKEFHVNLLTSICRGYSREYIAKQSGCSLKTLENHEVEAMNRVQDAIERTKLRETPILGGMAH